MRTDNYLRKVNETKSLEWIKNHLTVAEYEHMQAICTDEEDLPF